MADEDTQMNELYSFDLSDGEFSETNSNTYVSPSDSEEDTEAEGDVVMLVESTEDGWHISVPRDSMAIDTPASIPQTLSGSASSLEGPSTVVPQLEQEPALTTTHPRTARFVELQNETDNQIMRQIRNNFLTQINSRRSATNASATDTSHVESLARHAAIRNGSTSAEDSTGSLSEHFSSRTSVPGDQPNPNDGDANNTTSQHPRSSNHDTVHAERDGFQNGMFSITELDFARLMNSIENLSANVQTLIQRHDSEPAAVRHGEAQSTSIRQPYRSFYTRHPHVSDGLEEVHAQARTYRKKAMSENHVHRIMRELLATHQLRVNSRGVRPTLRDSVPKLEVSDFEAGRGGGPTLTNLRLDWTDSMSSRWNSTAIYILAEHVLSSIKNDEYAEVKYEDWMTSDRFFAELKAKLAESKREYEGIVASNAPDTDVTAAESRALTTAKKMRKATRNRRNIRRKTLYKCRLRIINENLGTHPTWDAALELMQVLGDGAMSDDETDQERSTRRKKVVRRVDKLWASGELKAMCNTIDLYYSRFYWNRFQKPGPSPRDRVTTIVSESPRPTPTNLPENCYGSFYLDTLSSYQKARLRYRRQMTIPTLPLPPS